jgi:hypothetical protein
MIFTALSYDDQPFAFVGDKAMQTNVFLGIAALAPTASIDYRDGLWAYVQTFNGDVFIAPQRVQGNFNYHTLTVVKNNQTFADIEYRLFGLYITYTYFQEISKRPQYHHLAQRAEKLKDFAASQFAPAVFTALFDTPWAILNSANLKRWLK